MDHKFLDNNFNLIRLLAAIEVLIGHIVEYFDFGKFLHPFLLKIIYLFPGVPIFFFISGFLISRSYETNSNIFEYIRNRVLRIYPALIICTTLSIIAVFAVGYISLGDIGFFELGKLILSQITIVQFYHPEYMRAYGDGVLNGNLWTITVELQFYVLIPIFYRLLKIENSSKSNFKLITLIIFFIIIHFVYLYSQEKIGNTLLMKLFFVSFLPWIYMFLIGVLFQINFEKIYKLLAGKFFLLFVLYCLIATFLVEVFHFHHSNTINPLLYFLLSCLIFSFAYSIKNLSKKILGNIDMSYGLYLFHMPIINFILYQGYTGITRYIFLFTMVIFFSYFSWKLVEQPCIRLKKHPFFAIS